MAFSEATREAMYLRGILDYVGMECERVTLFKDNQGAMKLVPNRGHHSRSKHIDVRHHFIRDVYRENARRRTKEGFEWC